MGGLILRSRRRAARARRGRARSASARAEAQRVSPQRGGGHDVGRRVVDEPRSCGSTMPGEQRCSKGGVGLGRCRARRTRTTSSNRRDRRVAVGEPSGRSRPTSWSGARRRTPAPARLVDEPQRSGDHVAEQCPRHALAPHAPDAASCRGAPATSSATASARCRGRRPARGSTGGVSDLGEELLARRPRRRRAARGTGTAGPSRRARRRGRRRPCRSRRLRLTATAHPPGRSGPASAQPRATGSTGT